MGRGITLALGMLSAPSLVVLLGLASAGLLAWPWALAAGLAVTMMILPMLMKHHQHLETLLSYLDRLRRGGRAAIGMEQHWQTGSPFLTPRLAEALRQTARELERQRQRVENAMAAADTILSNLPDPLLILSKDYRILRLNETAEELLGRELAGRRLLEVIRHPALLGALEKAFQGGEVEPLSFELPGAIVRHLTAHIVVLDMPELEATRTVAVVSLHDLTAIHRAEQLRVDFIANASHELRTPLSSLVGFIETLQGPARGDQQALENFLPIMQEQAQRMTRLVEDLLSLSRIELQEHHLPSGRVDLAAIIQTLAKGLALRAKERRIRIEIAMAASPPVVGDADELSQVFQNLLDNALKYGREGTSIRVEGKIVQPWKGASIRRLGKVCLAVRVSDQGEGIAPEHIPRLTERFYRVDTARSRNLGGTGLGLAIVKHIVNRHRGLLQIESTPGEGSTFTVYLPLSCEQEGEGWSDSIEATGALRSDASSRVPALPGKAVTKV